MATPKKKTATREAPAPEVKNKKGFDYNAFFAKNDIKYTEEDMRDVGGLMPIYASESAFEEDWDPLYGLLVNRVEIEIDKTEENPKQRFRWFYVIEAEAPTNALAGTGDDRETIDINPGDYVLMPESGALKNRDQLKIAACDPDEVHHVFFRVEGDRVDIGRPKGQEMWPIESKIVGNPIARKGRYVISNTARDVRGSMATNGTRGLNPGVVVDPKTGEVMDRPLVSRENARA